MNNTKEETATQMPRDQEALKVILENAEIDFTEDSYNGITSCYELDNGVKFHFGDDGELTGVEV